MHVPVTAETLESLAAKGEQFAKIVREWKEVILRDPKSKKEVRTLNGFQSVNGAIDRAIETAQKYEGVFLGIAKEIDRLTKYAQAAASEAHAKEKARKKGG